MKRAILTILILLSCADAYAQTVADIARRERERRASPDDAALTSLTAARSTSATDIGGRQDDVYRFYDVHGTTAAELRADVARLGPVSEGTRQQAVTNWKINWQTVNSASVEKCKVTLNVVLTVEIVLPRRSNEVGAQQPLSENWREYLTHLLFHEHGHKDIALAGAEEIRRLATSIQNTCAEAESTANAAGKTIVDKTAARQRQYDKETDHGRGQGVRLP